MVGEIFPCEKHKYKSLMFLQEIIKHKKYIR